MLYGYKEKKESGKRRNNLTVDGSSVTRGVTLALATTLLVTIIYEMKFPLA